MPSRKLNYNKPNRSVIPHLMSFSSLLRASPLNAFPATSVVVPASSTLRASGHWGLKRTVPLERRQAESLDVNSMDNDYGFPLLLETSQLKFQVMDELFSNIDADVDKAGGCTQLFDGFAVISDDPPNLATMSDDEFATLQKHVKSKKADFEAATTSNPILKSDPQHFLDFFNVTSTDDPNFPCSLSYRSVADTSIESNAPNPVKGRILNKTKGGFAVGIAGVVALLPDSPTHVIRHMFDYLDRSKIYDFYIQSARWSRAGIPNVVVSMRSPKTVFHSTTSPTDSRTSNSHSDTKDLENLLQELQPLRTTASPPKSKLRTPNSPATPLEPVDLWKYLDSVTNKEKK